MQDLRVAVDVGGTFTDVCIFNNNDHSMSVTKVPSTPHDPMVAVLNGIERGDIDLKRVELLSHGTTVATNALITRKFPTAAMVTTQGFRDTIEIRDGTKDDLWDAYKDVSGPYLRRRDRFEIPERTDYSGNIVKPVPESEAVELARILKKRGVTTIAVCFINSFINPENEKRMKEILQCEMPEASITTSADILPEIFEHDRFNTAIANALLGPLVSGYVENLEAELEKGGYGSDLLLLHSGGGSMTPSLVKEFPIRLAASGIAAGAIAARHVAEQSGFDHAIGLDMGGTSTDISLVTDGELHTTNRWEVEYGHPILFPSIEVLSIGAGGGSLAHIDIAGSLRNGPQSAGADPGPACYDRGGTQPTNTDANLLLGRLGNELAGGELNLQDGLSEAAIKNSIADPLGLEVPAAAESILDIANANMADAVRLVSIRRGLDPRDFALVAFGGAGALHGAEVARELDIPTVLVPPNPGVTSAMGCLLVDIQHDLSGMFTADTNQVDEHELDLRFRTLEKTAAERLWKEGVSENDSIIERSMSMRYQGQWRSLEVRMGSGPDALTDAIESFHSEHERQFALRQDDKPVEIYRIEVRALGKTSKPTFKPAERQDTVPDAIGNRSVYFDGSWHDTPVYDRAGLGFGMKIIGPAIIEQLDSTTVVPPNDTAEIDEWLNIRISLSTGA